MADRTPYAGRRRAYTERGISRRLALEFMRVPNAESLITAYAARVAA